METFLNSNILIAVSILWVLPWKGYALWISARKGQKWWFIALLVVNTLAIFEIIYIFLIAKRTDKVNKIEINKEKK